MGFVWGLVLGIWIFRSLTAQEPAWAGQEELRPQAVCLKAQELSRRRLLEDLDRAESAYQEYRWTERRIRDLYYGWLWTSRTHSLDPLDKAKREEGGRREAYGTARLEELEAKSADAANRFLAGVKKLASAETSFGAYAGDPIVRTCLQNTLAPAGPDTETLQKTFSRIFESERDYRLAVAETSGRRSGRYPQDTLEPSAEHDDFFSRFESARAGNRFEEDETILHALEALRYFFREDFRPGPCCLKIEQAEGEEHGQALRL